MDLLRQLHAQGSTIVMVTHSDEIAAYAQRVIRFRDGRIESDHANGQSRPAKFALERRPSMQPSKVIEIAWKGLVKNKLRSLLTMLGVIIGVAAVIIMIAISAGTEKTIEEQITGLGHQPDLHQPEFQPGRLSGPEAPGRAMAWFTTMPLPSPSRWKA